MGWRIDAIFTLLLPFLGLIISGLHWHGKDGALLDETQGVE
jgi:hypothetical protein